MEKKVSVDSSRALELWGGLECTVNRVADQYFSQLERNGHATRPSDIELFSSLGIKAIRYPVLWERTAPDGIAQADWSWPDERLPALRAAGVTPIAGLLHHGSGPPHTSLADPAFPGQLAEFAGAVAQRYPWLEYYTPVNEPLTTARFSGLYGIWYPHGRDDRTFIQTLLNQCRAVVLCMRAVRAVNPDAKLVQTDDLGKYYGTPEMAGLVEFYNHRRWLSWDLLCGKVGEDHALWGYLTASGVDPAEILWFRDNPCPPDIIGANYYITSERWVDHRAERYPQRYAGQVDGKAIADIETARALATPLPGIAPLLEEAWERYRLPIAVTEVHIDACREDQLRWLLEIWDGSGQARQKGVDVRAVTVWSLLGSFDWNCLVQECRGYYESGPFDVRSPSPRPTALTQLMRELASGSPLSHPVLRGKGWWRRPGRFFCKPLPTRATPTSISADGHHLLGKTMAPILIAGGNGALGRAFARICERRDLAYRLLTRQEMDIADPQSVDAAVRHYRPWAVVNAGGFARIDDAERDRERCFRDNATGPAVLAASCAREGVHLLTFSSHHVFDGARQAPYIESDTVAPLNVYGHSKAEAERRVLELHPDTLVVRSSAFFSPWEHGNFIAQALGALEHGQPFMAADDVTISPTYVPDLVYACLDLLIDRERGVWHLTSGQPLTWAEFALKAAELAGVDVSRLERQPLARHGKLAARPLYSALHSERALLLPSLHSALTRYVGERRESLEQLMAPGTGAAQTARRRRRA
jgi:dTDP-4-dehydrorhamnose reductase